MKKMHNFDIVNGYDVYMEVAPWNNSVTIRIHDKEAIISFESLKQVMEIQLMAAQDMEVKEPEHSQKVQLLGPDSRNNLDFKAIELWEDVFSSSNCNMFEDRVKQANKAVDALYNKFY